MHTLPSDKTDYEIAQKLLTDIGILKKTAPNQFRVLISGASSEKNEAILELFHSNITTTLENSYKDLYDNLMKPKSSGFTNCLAQVTNAILSSVLKFEEKLDSIFFDGTAKMVMKSSLKMFTDMISSTQPAVGFLIKHSGALDKAGDFLSKEQLRVNISSLQKTITQYEKSNHLHELFDKCSKTYELSEAFHIPIESLTRLNLLQLPKNSLQNLKTTIESNDAAKTTIQNLSKIMDIVPINDQEVDKFFSGIEKILNSSANNPDNSKVQQLPTIDPEGKQQFDNIIKSLKSKNSTAKNSLDYIINVQNSIKQIEQLGNGVKISNISHNDNKNLTDAIMKEVNTTYKEINSISTAEILKTLITQKLDKDLSINFATKTQVQKYNELENNKHINAPPR